jgi:hypothetical protein
MINKRKIERKEGVDFDFCEAEISRVRSADICIRYPPKLLSDYSKTGSFGRAANRPLFHFLTTH